MDKILENEEVRISMNCLAIDRLKNSYIQMGDLNQNIEFMYDKYIKGKQVAMILREGSIDLPNYEIYFTVAQLKAIMQFLIDSEK